MPTLILIRSPLYIYQYLKIKDNFVKVFILIHFVESFLKIVSIECFSWEKEHTRISKTSEIDEDIVLAS